MNAPKNSPPTPSNTWIISAALFIFVAVCLLAVLIGGLFSFFS